MAKEAVKLKDQLVNASELKRLSEEILLVYPKFDAPRFEKETLSTFDSKELKERLFWVADQLKSFLPRDYTEALSLILKSLPEPLDPQKTDNDFGHFIYASYGFFVAQNGCNEFHLNESLMALEKLTQRFSMEYAIRPFINQFPQESLEAILCWSTHPNYHVRRLASEGSRPKLPWGIKINCDFRIFEPVLDHLYSDETSFVVRSVANHLNDIAKIDPKFVLQKLRQWEKEKNGNSKSFDYLKRHALRTLIKTGNSGALAFLGYHQDAAFELSNFELSKEVVFGEHLHFSFELKALQECNLIIDFKLHFLAKNGQISRQKVFKLKAVQLENGAIQKIEKSLILKENMSTRQLYAGKQAFELLINGKTMVSEKFTLISPNAKID